MYLHTTVLHDPAESVEAEHRAAHQTDSGYPVAASVDVRLRSRSGNLYLSLSEREAVELYAALGTVVQQLADRDGVEL